MPKGSDYRVVKEHPGGRGPMSPVTDQAGNVIAKPGQVCSKVAAKFLRSMIANGYVEKIPREQSRKNKREVV